MKKTLSCLLVIYIFLVSLILPGSEVLSVDNPDALLEKMYEVNGSKQVVVVSSNKESDFKALLQVYERTEKGWIKPFPAMSAVIGGKGFSTKKIEGDNKAPAGIFKIGSAFGMADKPPYIKVPYKVTTLNDYWIDDVTSTDYNKWIVYDKNPYDRWKSFEKLRIPLYKYALIIEYNMNPVIKGRGSAIFLHLWKNAYSSTRGCTALSEENMLKLLSWVDPSKNPVIIQGTDSMINGMMDTADEIVIYPVRVKLNDKEIQFDVYPRIHEGRTLVPVRAVFEELGARVSWEASTKTVRVLKDKTDISLFVGRKYAYVDGSEAALDVPAIIIGGRTLVPLRFITEALGFKVDWDKDSRTVLISSK
ncbi:MAG: stalk domain-containing protein [Bacillota bacterium]